MKVTSTTRNVRMSSKKVREVTRQIQGLPVAKAQAVLSAIPRKSARLVAQTLATAIANAEHNHGADIDELKVSTIEVDEAPTFKRFRARAKGRGTRIIKRNSHITIRVGNE